VSSGGEAWRARAIRRSSPCRPVGPFPSSLARRSPRGSRTPRRVRLPRSPRRRSGDRGRLPRRSDRSEHARDRDVVEVVPDELRVGPRLPVPADRAVDDAGDCARGSLRNRRRAAPRHRAENPRTTTSARSTRRGSLARAGVFQVERDRALVAAIGRKAFVRSETFIFGVHAAARPGGSSTTITSAPKSARSIVQVRPRRVAGEIHDPQSSQCRHRFPSLRPMSAGSSALAAYSMERAAPTSNERSTNPTLPTPAALAEPRCAAARGSDDGIERTAGRGSLPLRAGAVLHDAPRRFRRRRDRRRGAAGTGRRVDAEMNVSERTKAFLPMGRNKRSIALDLKTARARQAFLRLVRSRGRWWSRVFRPVSRRGSRRLRSDPRAQSPRRLLLDQRVRADGALRAARRARPQLHLGRGRARIDRIAGQPPAIP